MNSFSKIAISLFLVLIYTACSSSSKFTKSPFSKKESINILGGSWINYDYLNAAKRTKSFAQQSWFAHELEQFSILGFFISVDSLKNNKSAKFDGFSSTEGGYVDAWTWDKASRRFILDSIPRNEGTYPSIAKARAQGSFDGFYQVKIIDKDIIALQLTEKDGFHLFKKVGTNRDRFSEDMNIMVNQLFLAGTYINTANQDTVVFKENGLIEGIPRIEKYEISRLFGMGGLSCDHLRVKLKDSNQKHSWWPFSYSQDTLFLSEVPNVDVDPSELQPSAIPRYKLLKIN